MDRISRLTKGLTGGRGFIISGSILTSVKGWMLNRTIASLDSEDGRRLVWERFCCYTSDANVKINRTGSRIHALQVRFNESELTWCLETADTCSLDSFINASAPLKYITQTLPIVLLHVSHRGSTCPSTSKILGLKYPNLSAEEMIYATRGADSFDFKVFNFVIASN